MILIILIRVILIIIIAHNINKYTNNDNNNDNHNSNSNNTNNDNNHNNDIMIMIITTILIMIIMIIFITITARRVILDRCNVDPADRRYLLELAFRPEGAVCVFFAAPPEVCEARVAARTSHPTIGFGGGRRAVQSMHKGLREPRTDEGFQEVVTVRDFAEAYYYYYYYYYCFYYYCFYYYYYYY